MTRLYTIGLSHRTAPIELRECVDFSRGGAVEALTALADRGISREIVVLSTCNRAEIYAIAGPRWRPTPSARFFADYHQVPLRATLRAPLRASRARKRPATCFASPPGSIRSSSENLRSSGR